MEKHNQPNDQKQDPLSEAEDQKHSQQEIAPKKPHEEPENDMEDSHLSKKLTEEKEEHVEHHMPLKTENSNGFEEHRIENDHDMKNSHEQDFVEEHEESPAPQNMNDSTEPKAHGQTSKQSDSQKLNNSGNFDAETKKKMSELNKARMAQLAEELKVEKKKAKEALDAGKTIFNIECCVNCTAHSYCTHHDENKYTSMFADLKQQIEASNPKYHVAKNLDIAKPRIGAFEIFYNGTLVYSKLNTKQWPKANLLLKRLENPSELNGKENQTEKVDDKGHTAEKPAPKTLTQSSTNKILKAK